MTLHELEQTIAKLPPAELSEFRQWFLRFDGDRWMSKLRKMPFQESLSRSHKPLYATSEATRRILYDSSRDIRFLGMLQGTSWGNSATCR